MRGLTQRTLNAPKLWLTAVDRLKKPARYALRQASTLMAGVLGLTFLIFIPLGSGPASAASSLNVFVGYFDTHSAPSSANQPKPWPYKNPASFVGTPCPNYPHDRACWDAGAIRLDNPTNASITKVKVVVTVGSKTYALWGSSRAVKAHGTLVLTETGSSKNSENFDLSDFSPNSYNGGRPTSCKNSGAIPHVLVTVGSAKTTYIDGGQVLNTKGVDISHCLNGKFVSGRMDESHPWVKLAPH